MLKRLSMVSASRSAGALLLGVLGLSAATVQAQVNPATVDADGGRLFELQRDKLPEPRLPAPEAVDQEVPAPPDTGARIKVTKFVVRGNTVLTAEVLEALVADAHGRELSIPELYKVAERITRYYRQQGYVLARAFIPAQPVEQGVVEILVSEGRLGNISVHQEAKLGGAALAPLENLKKGDVARADTLERSLLLLSDVPGIRPVSGLKAGTEPGTTDLYVDIKPTPLISGMVDADVNGSRYSGRNRLGLALNINNPFGIGDQIGLRTRASDGGLRFGLASYQLPINRHGTRLSATVSDLRYDLGGEVASLGLEGEARSYSLAVTHPIVRSRRKNVNAEFEILELDVVDRRRLFDEQQRRDVRRWNAALTGDWVDDWAGSNSWSVIYTHGELRLDTPPAPTDLTAARAGTFSKWMLSLRRLQAINPRTSALFSVTAQIAGENLDSSQKMVLGGVNGVRAYPQGEGFGDEGFLSVAELRRVLPLPGPGVWQGTAFVDHGEVRLSKTGGAADNHVKLTGAGIGMNASWPGGWGLRSALAWRLGNYLPAADDDGRPRFWMQASKNF